MSDKHAHLYDQGVWLDERTGLMWSRFSLGQKWQDGQAVGNAKKYTFDYAQEVVTDLTLAGFNDWRVPTIAELETLMIQGQAGYHCPEGALFVPEPKKTSKKKWNLYWSSSQSVCFHDNQYWGSYAIFYKGQSSDCDKMNRLAIRVVRTYLDQ